MKKTDKERLKKIVDTWENLCSQLGKLLKLLMIMIYRIKVLTYECI